jgi:hypothetical protein
LRQRTDDRELVDLRPVDDRLEGFTRFRRRLELQVRQPAEVVAHDLSAIVGLRRGEVVDGFLRAPARRSAA